RHDANTKQHARQEAPCGGRRSGMKIVDAVIERGSENPKDLLHDPNFGRGRVLVTLEDGTQEEAFTYYLDELSFMPHQFVGETLPEARQIRHQADIAYLRS